MSELVSHSALSARKKTLKKTHAKNSLTSRHLTPAATLYRSCLVNRGGGCVPAILFWGCFYLKTENAVGRSKVKISRPTCHYHEIPQRDTPPSRTPVSGESVWKGQNFDPKISTTDRISMNVAVYCTGKKTPGGAGTHTGHTRRALDSFSPIMALCEPEPSCLLRDERQERVVATGVPATWIPSRRASRI